MPDWHVVGPSQALLHQPQLDSSVERFTHAPTEAQYVSPYIGQPQRPDVQTWSPRHAVPQAPQLDSSADRSTQVPTEAQYVSPRPHTHRPATHDCAAGHKLPQAPQLDSSVWRSMVDAEPYYDRYSSGMLSTVTSDCIAPGAVGVMKGVQRAADPAFASTLTIDASPFRSSFTEHIAATDAPTLDVEVVETAEGWTVSGTMTPRRAIRNYGYRAFVRDARGVFVDELLAFPGELSLLPAFLPQTVETTAAERSFTEYRAFQSWITE